MRIFYKSYFYFF